MPEEKDIAERRSRLSPAQRALLQSRLGGESTARSIGPRARRAPQSLIPLQAAGAKPPFFCVHPSHGSVFGYVDLARYLGTDQPFYGLQSPALDGEQQSYHSIEDMATDYIRALRALGPQELYLLGGWSMGGIVAYEMAQQLLREGEQLGLLALFDVGPEAFGRRLTANDYSLEVNWFIAELILVIMVVYVTMVYGPIAAFLVELFPTRIRYTSMSLPYHIGNGWFGGMLPLLATAIVAAYGNIYWGLWYPIIVAVMTAVIGFIFLRETKDTDIAKT